MRRSAIVALLFVGFFIWSTPARAAVITLDTSIDNGDILVSIGIEDVVDLFTFGFDLSFDPSVVTPTDADPGDFLGGSFFFSIFPADAFGVPGVVSIFDSRLGPAPPNTGVSGSGLLALITFQALTGGDPGFALAFVDLFDSAGVQIEAEIVTSVPEPAAWALLGLGLLALRRRAHRNP